MTATLTIDLRECGTLHGVLSRRLLILVGCASEAGQESVGLTMPREKLAETLKGLPSDARRAPLSPRHEREPEESVDQRWRRFRQAVEVREELLCRLDSSGQGELAAYIPVTDGFVLAALEPRRTA